MGFLGGDAFAGNDVRCGYAAASLSVRVVRRVVTAWASRGSAK
jgi:hypothetical protein